MDRTYSSAVEHKTHAFGDGLYATGQWIGNNWQKGVLIALVLIVVLKKDVAINLQMQGGPQQGIAALTQGLGAVQDPTGLSAGAPEPDPAFGRESAPENEPGFFSRLWSWAFGAPQAPYPIDPNLANTFSNLDFSDASASASSREIKRARQLSYVDRFAGVAREESLRYGIPASITLAQGLLESNAGYSNLATKNNNHFGIKCFSKACTKGHCRNFSDDHHKDFFRVYANPWESYRAHSELLQKSRYRHLKKLNMRDYKNWARGLQKAGYATDPKYATKLIHIIEDLGLDAYDS